MPGPKRASQRRTSSAYPSAVVSGSGTSPSQDPVVRQRGRKTRQWVVLAPRTTRASAPSSVRIRPGLSWEEPRSARTSIVGTTARSSVIVRPSGASSRAPSTSPPTSVNHRSGSVATPAATRSRCRRARSEPAVREAALPHAAGSRSRGKTNSVRRMASCLTRLRSVSIAALTSARVTPSTRACTDRCTVAGSVECSTTTDRVAPTGSAARCPGASAWRRASRARRSVSSTSLGEPMAPHPAPERRHPAH